MQLTAFFKREGWKDKDPAKRLKAVTDMTDQALLHRIASTDSSASVRAAAVKRINNDAKLWEILAKEQNAEVCLRATNNIISQEYLGKVARFRAMDMQTRLAAIDRLTDQEVLEQLALGDASKAIRMAAIAKVKSPRVLEQVISDDHSGQVINLASQRLSNGSGRFTKG